MKKNSVYLLSLLTLLFLVSCETIDDAFKDFSDDITIDAAKDEKPEFVLSVHRIVKYPRAQNLEKRVTTLSGVELWINRNPFIHSRFIEKIKLVPIPDKDKFYDLKLKLDRRGRLLWMQISVEFRNEDIALAVDGVVYKVFRPQQVSDEESQWATIQGPFDEVTATAIKKFAPNNYKYFHRNE